MTGCVTVQAWRQVDDVARAERRKGVVGEREFARVWTDAGFEVRGLESGGDLTITGRGVHLHGESKRQERAQVPLWVRQVERDARDGVPWVLGYRASREPWTAVVRLDTFLSLLDGDVLAELLAEPDTRAFYVNGLVPLYVRTPLAPLVERLAA